MPRSPSRDLADRFAQPGGTRHRYFEKFNSLEQWKILLSRLAVAGVLVWGGLLLFTKKLDPQTSHGPLASVHAPWDAKCEACHRTPENAGWFNAQAKWRTFECQKCHGGPPHSANIKAGDASEDCSSCHHDHAGRDVSLVKISDSHCVRCHANLATVSNRTPPYQNDIRSFASHPEFKAKDQPRPSTLKFSHSQHMTPGIVAAPGGQSSEYGMKDGKPVQLDCKSCHTLDSAGRYYQPISYEKHCAACHPTKMPGQVSSAGEALKGFDVPHGQKTDVVRSIIEGSYASELKDKRPEIHDALRFKSNEPQHQKAILKFREEIDALTREGLEKVLRTSKNACSYCHSLEGEAVKPANIPAVWMTHAKFDHAAHRAMNCKDCHPNSQSKVENGTTYHGDRGPVDLPNHKSCVACHAPGNIETKCADCHSYHHGAEAPKTLLDIQQLLKGH